MAFVVLVVGTRLVQRQELSVLAEVKSVVEELVCNVRTESVGVAARLFVRSVVEGLLVGVLKYSGLGTVRFFLELQT
jgi:hypothetical protein